MNFIPLSRVISRAILDMYGDPATDTARFTVWAVDGYKKLKRFAFPGGKKKALLAINKNLNNVVYPCDVDSITFVGLVDDCGHKVPITPKDVIVDIQNIKKVPCNVGCSEKCASDCYDKSICNELLSTQTRQMVRINNADYPETVTKTLLPDGVYRVVVTTPYYDATDGLIKFRDYSEFETSFDVNAECGCLLKTENNEQKLKEFCYNSWVCHCSPCADTINEIVGYNIFDETKTIQLDGRIDSEFLYIEYIGALPQVGADLVIPEVLYEVMVAYVKYCSICNRRGIPIQDKNMAWQGYLRELSNVELLPSRNINLKEISEIMQTTPSWNINYSADGYFYKVNNYYGYERKLF